MIAGNRLSLRQEFLKSIKPYIHVIEPHRDPDQFQFLTSQEFAARDEKHEWLVEDMLVANQPGVIGGLAKDCKTGLAVDLVLSLGTGRPFLGKFRVPTPKRTAIISIESGFAALKDTAERICHCKGVSLSAAEVDWCTRFPRLDSDTRLGRLSSYIRSRGLQVLVLDPLYLILPVRREGVAPGDLYGMGDLFARLGDVCLSAGCTPVLVHHLNKSSSYRHRKLNDTGRGHWDPPELFDLSQAGAAEYFRQWMLLGRRRPFDQEIGLNQLWMSVGGSAGFSGLWAVDILEGRLHSTSGDRRWDVTVRTRAKLIEEEAREKVEQKTIQQDEQLMRDCYAVLKALSTRAHGETERGIREESKLSAERLRQAIEHLLMVNWIGKVQVKKAAGTAGQRGYGGYRLTEEGRKGFHGH